MRTWYRSEGMLAKFVIACFVVAVVLDLVALFIGIGIAKDGSGRGFFESINWGPYPLFFILMGWLVYITWHPYLAAWRTIASQGLLHVSDDLVKNDSILVPLVDRLHRSRKMLILVTFFLAILIAAVVDHCLWGDYGLLGLDPCLGENGKGWGQAFRGIPEGRFTKISKVANGIFLTTAYTMMAALIGLGLLALAQVFMHSYLFMKSNQTLRRHIPDAKLVLNHRDGGHQFGLSDWNYAINNGYIAIGAGMAIPVLSDVAQFGEKWQLSQYLFAFLLPLILFAPAYVPWFVRYYKKREVELQLRHRNASNEEWGSFRDQKIWPFDQHPIGKLFLVAAVILYGYTTKDFPLIKEFLDMLKN